MIRNKASIQHHAGAVCAVVIIALAALRCAPTQLAGGGSDTEVCGRLVAQTGAPAQGAIACLVDTGYDPASDVALPSSRLDTTDAQGNFQFNGLQAGVYNIWAIDRAAATQVLIKDVAATAEKRTSIGDRTLTATAVIKLLLPDSLAELPGMLSVTGTLICVQISGNVNPVVLPAVPQGVLSSIRFRKTPPGSKPIVLHVNVAVDSAGTVALDPVSGWKHEARLTLNTTPGGAAIPEALFDFPILVRLTSADIDFSQALGEGEDLRFASAEGRPLPFEIEYWDSGSAAAAVWVRVEKVSGNASSESVRMLWGNPAAKKASQPEAVFDTGRGFQGVWHLGDTGPDEKKDATANRFNAIPVGLTGASDITGIAGRALDLNGVSQCVIVQNSRGSRLDVQTDSFFTVSAWVYARAVQGAVLSKGEAQCGLTVNQNVKWKFSGTLRGSESGGTLNAWTYVTAVREGARQFLYVNDTLTDSTVSPDSGAVGALYDFVIGRRAEDESGWFNGMVDELRVESQSRPSAWVRLCFENQRAGQRFVTIRKVR
jgi:hypothetical protein